MNDRELLELAAKSAGYEPVCVATGGYLIVKHPVGGPESCLSFSWSPLEDDGDALRLAVKLGIVIDPSGFTTCCEHNSLPPYISESHRDGKDSATRRAITRAAAEIGRGMQ